MYLVYEYEKFATKVLTYLPKLNMIKLSYNNSWFNDTYVYVNSILANYAYRDIKHF